VQTGAFWYINKLTSRTTWDCPLPLQKDLICSWNEGKLQQFYAGTTAAIAELDEAGTGKCRCMFKSAVEYQQHMINAHKYVPTTEYAALPSDL
jgi:hypothetical protein